MRIANYESLALLHTTRVSRIYRAREQETARSVIVKVAQRDPIQDCAPLLERDYRLCIDRPAPWRLTPLAFQQESGQSFAVFDDPGGEPLHAWVKDSESPLHARLPLALALVEVLAAIHREGLIHKDFSSPNILLTPGQTTLRLLDFSLSTVLSREDTEISNFGLVVGHPAFCAPEQSGRMNRSIDARSDHYALGAALYQLFTGSPPFPVSSTMELLHAHIAIAPVPPAAKSIELPKALSDVILKLLEKAPENRYQSLDALRHDLLIIEREWQGEGMRSDFIPGETDQQRVFTVSTTLYGREAAQQQLIAGLADAARGGTAVTMVAGDAGTGKTALVQSIYGPLTQSQAYYVNGKFDQLHRDQPYTALMGAIQQLLRGILTEPEERLEPWRQALRGAVGSHAGLLTPLIPEFEWIIGPQAAAKNLEADESSRVFSRITLRVIQVFCSSERPLVMYIDDLQWADRASLQLLEQLLQESTNHFYFIGAYRDDEVSSGHFLNTLLKRLEERDVHYRHVSLAPLTITTVTALLADSLAQHEEQVRTLAIELLNKTGGVPFFVHQFLESLYRQGYITPDPEEHSWHLKAESLQELPATENQLEWMATKLRQFDANSQQVLQSAACLGARFSLSRLAQLESVPLDELTRRFQPALEAGLISISRDAAANAPSSVKGIHATHELFGHFAHDRIQQAAYRIMSSNVQRHHHHRIGKLMLEETASSKEARERQLFEIVQQLNRGDTANYDHNTCLELARLNAQAGQKARHASAHDASFHFFTQAISLLPGDAWEQEYALTLSLHDGAQKAAFLSQR